MLHTLTATQLFDLSHTLAAPLLRSVPYPWEALDGIGSCIASLGAMLDSEEYRSPHPHVWIHRTARIAPTAAFGEWVIVGAHTEVRHGAFIRGKALIGQHAVVGNSTELKNVILFDRVQVPHYNYVGDSVLGYAAHLGAGAITSNVKSDKTPIDIRCGTQRIATHRKKLGAMLGDRVEIGCGCVLAPGAVIGRDSRVYPLSFVRGTVPAAHIYKQQGEITPIR